MNVVIISKEKYEEMVGKLNCLSDRVNEILRKREGKRLSHWMDNQEVCQQLRISPRTLQTLRDNGIADAPRQRYAGLLADRAQDFLQAGGCAAHRPARGGQT